MTSLYHKKKTLNFRGELFELSRPQIMGILNVTPDSFFDGGSYTQKEALQRRISTMLSEGVDLIDIGAYSSRPGAAEVPLEEEIQRLDLALSTLVEMGVQLPLSIDTFRSKVADWALENYPVAIINDISAGDLDEHMFEVLAKHQVTYLMMHMRGTPQNMQELTQYQDLTAEILKYFSDKIAKLKAKGLKDFIIDPGFGFAKTLEQNYQLLSQLQLFEALEQPLLIGLSRKSMIYKKLDCSADEALNGTTAAHMIALSKGADILRVHDVKAAKECLQVFEATFRPDFK